MLFFFFFLTQVFYNKTVVLPVQYNTLFSKKNTKKIQLVSLFLH